MKTELNPDVVMAGVWPASLSIITPFLHAGTGLTMPDAQEGVGFANHPCTGIKPDVATAHAKAGSQNLSFQLRYPL